MRVFRPAPAAEPAPAMLYLHGGGLVMGSAALGDRFCRLVAGELGFLTASVEYRLAPEHPYPVPLQDCYAGLRWLAGQPGVDPARIAIAGESAGGGLAAALTLMARDRGEIVPALQVLSYPMLDDRTTARTDFDARRLRMWSPASNRFGWRSYLRHAGSEIPALAAPARAEDLSELPPAWIGVGTRDLFHDENADYAQRLRAAGVPCELHVVPGGYHSFDSLESRTPIARDFLSRRLAFLSGLVADQERDRPA
ncbi:alpha/beta hydrolase [Nocardia sp. NPDC057227]|uniref:alpha/beta hydrolase n=1 Tax=Nocardia sp. NPDC057227 TaxID=3346056 RepID=UPI00362E4FAB